MAPWLGERRSNRPVFIGLAVSVVFHLGMLIPAMIFVMGAATPHQAVEARFEPEDFRREEPPEEPVPENEVELGIDAETSAKLTWIGYDQYQEHMAALSETEQAQFTEHPGEAGEPIDSGEATAAIPSEPAPAANPQVAQQGVEGAGEAEEQQRPMAAQEAVDEALAADDPTSTEPAPAAETEISEAQADPSPAEVPTELARRELPDDPTARPLLAASETDAAFGPPPPPNRQPHDVPDDREPQPADNAAVTPPVPDTGKDETLADARPTQEDQQPSQPAATAGGNRPGDVSDAETDATSIVDVPVKKLGQPLAAHGLVLKPKRPEFTTLQRLHGPGRNPVVEIRFGRDGRPKNARVLDTSGNPEMDKVILASLYRWRARGDQLKDLLAEETVNIRMRIVMIRRR